MANFSITREQKTLKLLKEVTEEEIKKALNKIGEKKKKKMQSDIAVDTANAQKSVKKHLKRVDGGWGVAIYPSTRYYYYQEIGKQMCRLN